MLPSVLARQIRVGVEDQLRASFAPSTKSFEHIIERFIAEPDTLLKGPWLSLEMPFRRANRETEFFADIPSRFPSIPASGACVRASCRCAPEVGDRRHRYGLRQDRMLPASNLGCLSQGERRTRDKGDHHLPDECARWRSSAAPGADDRNK